MAKVNEKKSCYDCKHQTLVIGSCHTNCTKPDPDMTGDSYGRSQGWFFYPINFDPVWMTKECANFESVVSNAVSGAEVEK